jgi:hypothetical protein
LSLLCSLAKQEDLAGVDPLPTYEGYCAINAYVDCYYPPRTHFAEHTRPMTTLPRWEGKLPESFTIEEMLIARAVFDCNRDRGVDLVKYCGPPGGCFRSRTDLLRILDTSSGAHEMVMINIRPQILAAHPSLEAMFPGAKSEVCVCIDLASRLRYVVRTQCNYSYTCV